MSTSKSNQLWATCLEKLRIHFSLGEKDFNTWLKPLQIQEEGLMLLVWAPNKFLLKGLDERFLQEIQRIYTELKGESIKVITKLGPDLGSVIRSEPLKAITIPHSPGYLNVNFDFSTFVEGKSNQLALAAAIQVAENPGVAYNPLLVYGGVGLGKTHLLHAIGNTICKKNPEAKVLYLHSERFVSDLVKALRTNTIDQFKPRYRSVDCLLIDDIQFLSGKDRSQEEFFHTFNNLLEGQKQVVLTCDRYPKEIPGVEERLKSRLGWGLTVAVEPPDLETRVAILINKTSQMQLEVPQEVAFFVAKRIRSNVRELEGVLKRIAAYSQFMDKPITLELVKEAIRDILAIQDKLVTIDNIMKTVAEYYGKGVDELLQKTRKAKIAQARQVAMALTKELTNHSYPEIAKAFGGRDHTTVLYAVKKIRKEQLIDSKVGKAFTYLFRILSGE
jgi:chromosomal replication initiator protein